MTLEQFEGNELKKITRLIPKGGAEISDCVREAIAYALVERTEVHFVHNGRQLVVTEPTAEVIKALCVCVPERTF